MGVRKGSAYFPARIYTAHAQKLIRYTPIRTLFLMAQYHRIQRDTTRYIPMLHALQQHEESVANLES